MIKKSYCFSGRIGKTYKAADIEPDEYALDAERFMSEGNWAFCRFNESDFTAARLGFERGSFNITEKPEKHNPDLLQLHLELMTEEGAVLWVPTGKYPSSDLVSSSKAFDMSLKTNGKQIFSITGWPQMQWHFSSEDDDLDMQFNFELSTFTILPDCLLPYSVFSMWASTGSLDGIIRIKNISRHVSGRVFLDHPRVLPNPSGGTPRSMYLYTTMFFEDGSALFGYHAEKPAGDPIPYYCFGIFIDSLGNGTYFPKAEMKKIIYSDDSIPDSYYFIWEDEEFRIECETTVQYDEIKYAWGSTNPPVKRRDFSILPLVLTGSAKMTGGGQTRTLKGKGLGEYFNEKLWFS